MANHVHATALNTEGCGMDSTAWRAVVHAIHAQPLPAHPRRSR